MSEALAVARPDEWAALIEPTSVSICGSSHVKLFGRASDLGRIADQETRQRMATHLSHCGVRRIFAVNGEEFNAELVLADPSFFPHHDKHAGIDIFYGVHADAVVGLRPGDAFWLRSADCPTVVMEAGDLVLVMHAGRDSLVTRHWLQGKGHLVNRPGVVERATAFIKTPIGEASAWILCGIGRGSFLHPHDHPTYGDSNKALYEHITKRWGHSTFVGTSRGLSLSMPDLIESQLFEFGFAASVVASAWDGVDTATDRRTNNSEFTWWSASRGDKDRNHVVVYRPLET